MTLKVDGLSIEWDAQKNALNLKKHGIGFKEASNVFFDENRVEFFDAKHSEQEDRFATIGMVRDIILVIYTERKAALRIISARKATPSERKIYYGKNS